jgi:hypothetical protein
MLFVLAAVAVGLLLMLLVGLLIRPEDGKQPTGGRPLQVPGTVAAVSLR